ncbi:hypothetical protein TREMEDRAFT_30136 [Tremella mesenterica DSM 1558]|uniref:uncharacterized protein n=1 Tax=Tremella mesenterica (strain ATCC 24925 / CBS 8224 / DSM 1558 / NBRC 9311 / NRRL Y-6157 / RJB 2259-6 / UBC 559-6) TaxID=578456 RepID=UPI0003F491B5|nr:uncharacterized protein TREMEDRAFT_30136 [Tremella mesenterica DSM 1558]EIW70297.1 hypothetical protein TREMEDRAFT_30136 [Tremella mesenterica DSM 1558]
MKPTTSIFGASRLPLTTKRGNKDFYKGARQSYVPGGGHRTGPPGKHMVSRKGKYRLLDDQVRFYVGPGEDTLSKTKDDSSPTVSARTDDNVHTSLLDGEELSGQVKSEDESNIVEDEETKTPSSSSEKVKGQKQSKEIPIQLYFKFSKQWQSLNPIKKKEMIFAQRAIWWAGLERKFGKDISLD